MSSKEYDTLQPIPSQAERDLAFLDASVQNTDLGSKHLPASKKLRRRPWIANRMNSNGRVLQILIISLISLGGFTLGLRVLGIPVHFSNVYLLLRYGYASQTKGLQWVTYDGHIVKGSDDLRIFRIQGKVFNFDNDFLPERKFVLNLFDQNHQPLKQLEFSCCSQDFFPRKMTDIEMSFPVSSEDIGSFEIK